MFILATIFFIIARLMPFVHKTLMLIVMESTISDIDIRSVQIMRNRRSRVHIYPQRLTKLFLNPQTPFAQEIADEVVSRHFQGEGVEFFFKSDLTDPPPHQIFDAHLLETIDLSPSRFQFSVDFISRSCFESDSFMLI